MTLPDRLRRWYQPAGRIVVLGVGNPLRLDDGVGIAVIKALEGHVSDSVYLLDSETVPENHLDQIVAFEPTHILIVDAAFLGRPAGSIHFVTELPAAGVPISTHALPLQLFCEYLRRTTGAKIGLLLVQPSRTEFGEGLSASVREATTTLRNLLLAVPSIRK
jgi:hydrogenase 3 maturation protease